MRKPAGAMVNRSFVCIDKQSPDIAGGAHVGNNDLDVGAVD